MPKGIWLMYSQLCSCFEPVIWAKGAIEAGEAFTVLHRFGFDMIEIGETYLNHVLPRRPYHETV